NPAIIGWDWHQRQQRSVVPDSMVTRRIEAVQLAYSSPSAEVAHSVFRRFGVEYIVVGQLEQAYFPGGVGKFAQGVGRFWTVAYQNPGVTIYRMIEGDPPRVGRAE
ncbi:MAG: hypothetical protein NZ518_12340, partial [Dehalococcoidia bacterium]|nr:hypothetical protein [Dehalococcoidia bacterium]